MRNLFRSIEVRGSSKWRVASSRSNDWGPTLARRAEGRASEAHDRRPLSFKSFGHVPRSRVGLVFEQCVRLRGVTWLLAAFCLSCLSACDATPAGNSDQGRVLVIGMDGLDPQLLTRYMAEEKLPHFAKLAAMGGFTPLATSMPPQSPVAWSNVISGCRPGTHQIYDFIHRDPNPDIPGLAIQPYLSTSSNEPPASGRQISLGQWQIPLASGSIKLERQGPSFWNYLVGQGVDATIYRMPANYPAQHVQGGGCFHCLTGMGTPDLSPIGSYGEFTLFTPDAPLRGRPVSGGRLAYLYTDNHRAEGELEGPKNFLRKPDENWFAPNHEGKVYGRARSGT